MSMRTERVGSLIREEVGTYIAREYRDSAAGLITVTEVHMTPDLRIARIYVSILGNAEVRERTLAMLERNKAEIRAFIGSHMRLKFTPTVQLYLDETLDRVEKIENLIRQIHKDDHGNPNPGEPGAGPA
jgi:ribosome-binding factor A